MVNIVSSAITNNPPSDFIANSLSLRNKLHTLRSDNDTNEDLMDIFHETPERKANHCNRTILPRRNYCIITEHAGLVASRQEPEGKQNKANGTGDNADVGDIVESNAEVMQPAYRQRGRIDDISAQIPQNGTNRRYALDVCIRAETNVKDKEGHTTPYGFSIPSLK